MLFHIDFDAATAVYRQLVDQVCHAAAAGTLKPHDPLPSIRPLAKQLHLNRNTVAKAYTELETLGVIRTIPGKGCFIEPVKTPFTAAVRHKLLVAKIDAALIAAHQLQVNAKTFSTLVGERARIFEHKVATAQDVQADEPVRSQPIPTPASAPTSASTLTSTISTTSDDADRWTPGTD